MQDGSFRQSCIDSRAGVTVSISREQLAIIALGKKAWEFWKQKDVYIGIEEDNHYTNIIQREYQVQISGEK